nr:RNA-directed DNA polymerase, eukaryota, reverse transcriptase zinc-binding domain protein [Tanacetum cinerariifolium]
MRSYRSKEDEVVKISTSVFVANFSDSFGAKDLWNTCKKYGQVVDAYIPYRRSKAGKRFGFVRFIKPLKRHNSLYNIDEVKRRNPGDTYNSNEVKDFATLANLKVVVANKGFNNIKFKYMGGYWVMMEFQTKVTKLKFQENSVMKTWFSQIQLASSDFNTDGRDTWVEIEGIPLKLWSKNTFNRVASKWGILLDVDDQEDEHFHRKRIYFMEDNDEEENSEVSSYEEVPNGEDVKNVEDLEGHFKKFEFPKSGGSILQLIDDLVKVRETMGASVGNSGGILCVWDPNMFKNTNSMVKGDWMSNGKKLLIISVVIMGDFNKVRNKSKSFGTLFNRHGADVFNRFISNAGLKEVPLEGCSFTWCHRSATKMSKLDRFLISDSLLCSCPNISSITLDRYLSDHRPILMSQVYYDYGSVPFRFFHYWFEVDGFDKFIEDFWKDAPIIESNALIRMMKKLKRTEVVKLLQEVEKKNSLEAAQKEKIKWAIEGDENSKYYHGVINKKMNQLSIRVADLECQVSKEEIKKAVWDCGIDKSPGLDGFTFGFYHRYWKLIENDVVDAVKDYRPISLIGSMYKIISKILANRLVVVLGGLVNEFQSAFVVDKQILDGPFILNELVQWCKKKKKQSLIFKVDFEKAYDSVRRAHLDDIMRKFGFGEKRCMWIQICLRSSRGSVIMNGSPTKEFQFYKGLKQGDRLSHFLFILVMESLHISFQRVVDVGLFKGIELAPSLNLSHMFYAHDAIFMGQWSASSYGIYAILFFNGAELSSKKSVWVKWKHALAPKDKGGLGVSSLFGLNRALMFKWVWRFITQGSSLWARVIKALHGYDGKISQKEVAWRGGSPFKSLFPRLYALETQKKIDVASKLSHSGLDVSFRRPPRGGVKIQQFEHMKEKVEGCILVDMMDRWFWALKGSGEFTITSVRKIIDDVMLPEVSSKSCWIKAVL